MHVYTMGTRAYAEEVCAAIDPNRRIFGGRILSRDESGSECVVPICEAIVHVLQALHKRVYSDFSRAIHLWSSSSTIGRMSGNGVQT